MNTWSHDHDSESKPARLDGLERVFYRGPSMYPTLQPTDVLHVRAYEGREIRRGDVIVFACPGSSAAVAHRVVTLDPRGLGTMGDNNDAADTCFVTARDVKGQVEYAQRGRKLRRIYGGRLGRFTGAAMRLRKACHSRFRALGSPVYHWLAQSGVLRKCSPGLLRPKVVRFDRQGATELQLCLGKRSIGRLPPDRDRWQIRYPYRLFVDEADLGNGAALARTRSRNSLP